ncbi:PAS domain-containing sensor histidine kinase [Asticcacaulis sp. 201]|uniref:hybrid sensor histidine kinase/response regulator n=1 Tax=Asticcacaulis sp. 201 TaxID=3028787 RepID=UPI0029160F70|nr:PAS domain-containing protein [Asticcacaulis sp. 201]MDV6332690.1 PAS domain-containing protein [Asticcacaulis sp. 201]
MSSEVSKLFPSSHGMMAEKVRRFDWGTTSLGPIEQWPASLRIVVDLMLSSAFPKCLFWGPDLVAIYNDAYHPLTGNKPDSLGEPYRVTWAEVWEDMLPIIDKAWAGEATFIEDYMIPVARYGAPEEAYFTFCYSPVRDETGAVVGIMDTVVETTNKVKTEHNLKSEREALMQLFEQAPTFMTVLRGPDHVFEYANSPYLSLVGNRDIIGKPLAEALPEVVEQGFVDLLHTVYTTGQAFTAYAAPVSLIQPDGTTEERFLDFVYQPIRDADGTVGAIFVEGADVTSRHLAEQALQDRDDRLRELNENLERQVADRSAELDRIFRKSRDVQIVMGLDGIFLNVSPAWETILGRKPSEAVGCHFSEFIWPEDAERGQANLEHAVERGDLTDSETRYIHADGAPRWISWRTTTEGNRIYAYGRDVTHEKRQAEALQQTEQQLRQAQKMEAVGQLTGGIAHDFNNMLAVIMGSLDLLGRRIGDGDPRAKRFVDAALEAAKRAANLTQRLLAFSRQQPLRPESINVNALVANMSDLLRHSLGSDIRLETVLTGGPWQTHADPNQLENVILNLGVNARDAMPDGGRLTIETQNAHLDDRYVAAHIGVPAGQYVLIAITDTGEGMTQDVLAKAFDPFFTTKAVGKGTGLGLSQVYGFVKQSGGHVKIYSEPGEGTTVKIYLPRTLGKDVESEEDVTHATALMGENREVILVVDDEPAVRQLSVDALTELGYRVLEAEGAASALALINQHPEIALLFTDIVMPEANGRKLSDAARLIRPDLKVLYTTGYTRNAVVHNGVVDAGVELIGKPFSIDQLAAKVRDMLDRG